MIGRLLCWLGFHKYYTQDVGSAVRVVCLRKDCIYGKLR